MCSYNHISFLQQREIRKSIIYQKILKGILILCFYSFSCFLSCFHSFFFPSFFLFYFPSFFLFPFMFSIFFPFFLSFFLYVFYFSFLSFLISSPFLIFPPSLDCLFPGMFPLLSGNMKIHTTIKIFFKKFFLLFASFSKG